MAWFIGIGVVSFALWLFLVIRGGADAFCLFIVGMVTFIGGMIMNAIIQTAVTGTHYEVSQTYELHTLHDSSGTTGSFFLGSGTIDSKPVFMYYEKQGDSYFLRHADADFATVIESTSTPHVDKLVERANNKWWGLAFGAGHSVNFYVPKGSVVSNYTLDAK